MASLIITIVGYYTNFNYFFYNELACQPHIDLVRFFFVKYFKINQNYTKEKFLYRIKSNNLFDSFWMSFFFKSSNHLNNYNLTYLSVK